MTSPSRGLRDFVLYAKDYFRSVDDKTLNAAYDQSAVLWNLERCLPEIEKMTLSFNCPNCGVTHYPAQLARFQDESVPDES